MMITIYCHVQEIDLSEFVDVLLDGIKERQKKNRLLRGV